MFTQATNICYLPVMYQLAVIWGEEKVVCAPCPLFPTSHWEERRGRRQKAESGRGRRGGRGGRGRAALPGKRLGGLLPGPASRLVPLLRKTPLSSLVLCVPEGSPPCRHPGNPSLGMALPGCWFSHCWISPAGDRGGGRGEYSSHPSTPPSPLTIWWGLSAPGPSSGASNTSRPLLAGAPTPLSHSLHSAHLAISNPSIKKVSFIIPPSAAYLLSHRPEPQTWTSGSSNVAIVEHPT